MTRFQFLFLLGVASLLSISIFGEANNKMLELQKTLNFLLVRTTSGEKYTDPFEKKEIEQNLKMLVQFSHRVDMTKTNTSFDPIVRLIPDILQEASLDAYLSFREGNPIYSRTLIRNTMNTCISCHLRTDQKRPLQLSFFQPDPILSDFEKAQFLSVSRQYSAALELYMKAIRNPKLDQDELESAVGQALMITLEIMSKPAKAIEIAQALIHEKHIPFYLKVPALDWKKTLMGLIRKKNFPPETEKELYHEADQWMNRAKKIQKYPNDRTSDVHYRMASGYLNELIRKHPKSQNHSNYLYLQGICYDALSPKKPESLSNLYYESCIRQSPHTGFSEKCYRKYEENIYFDYSGPSGIRLPEEIKTKLLELWGMSMLTKRSEEVIK